MIQNDRLGFFIQQEGHSISYSHNRSEKFSRSQPALRAWHRSFKAALASQHCTAKCCVVSLLCSTARIYYTFSKKFSQASILTVNYRLSPAQTGKKSLTQHTYFCTKKFTICSLDSMKDENNWKGEWIPMVLCNLHIDRQIITRHVCYIWNTATFSNYVKPHEFLSCGFICWSMVFRIFDFHVSSFFLSLKDGV